MHKKMQELQTKLEIRQAEKKGAASIETIIVSALLIALAVGLVTAFSKTLGDSGSASNKATATAVNKAVTQAGTNQTQTAGSVTVAP
jgi:hypothetical protein